MNQIQGNHCFLDTNYPLLVKDAGNISRKAMRPRERWEETLAS